MTSTLHLYDNTPSGHKRVTVLTSFSDTEPVFEMPNRKIDFCCSLLCIDGDFIHGCRTDDFRNAQPGDLITFEIKQAHK